MMMKSTLTAFGIAMLASIVSSAWASPFATELVSYSSTLTGSSLYNDPYAVLGHPSTQFNNRTIANPELRRVKLVEPAFNTGPANEKLITTLSTGQQVTVKFDHQVTDDPQNPYGLDFLVFGNAFFVGNGFVSDASNMNTYMLTNGSVFAENMKISVSQDGTNWYTYNNGPYGDSMFPTNGYLWDAANAVWTNTESDYTKPVNPALKAADFAAKSAANAIALYQGSAGGTGFDLAESGLPWIQYIKVEGVSGFSGGEIDGFSDVAAVPEPASLVLLLAGGVGLLARRRRG